MRFVVSSAYIGMGLAMGLILTACSSTKYQPITPPTVVKSPDFSNLPTKSCKNGELITTSATLKLDRTGRVTSVSGIKVKDKQLARQISEQFKKAKYTPYLEYGTPIARPLKTSISLQCPKKGK